MLFLSTLTIIIIPFYLFFNTIKCQVSNTTAEKNLVSVILGGTYSKNIRPSDVVTIVITVSIKQIIGIDEKNQIMTSSYYIGQLWTDSRLAWTPATYNNIEVIMVPLKNIWTPDTIVLNSAEGDGYLKINSDFSYVSVKYTGEVYFLSQSLALKTRCALNVQNYPFDYQNCKIRMTSWSNADNRIKYSVESTVVDLSDFRNNTIWALSDADVIAEISSDRVPFETSQNTEIVIVLVLSRKSLYYMMNTVFPCFILNIVTLLTFFMPFGNQIGLAMTGFLTFSVYSLRIASDIPVQSDYLPKISTYFISSISFNLMAMNWFVLRNRFMTQGSMPRFLEIICDLLKKVFCYCFPEEKKTSNKTAPDDKVAENGEANKVGRLEQIATNKIVKCSLCDRCDDCQADHTKEKDKNKKKKDMESKLEAFNYLYFIILFISMFITQIVIWTSLSI